ncbi:MAG: hypothetical protein ACKVON_01880 [Beijerinckiaceae bacterium]
MKHAFRNSFAAAALAGAALIGSAGPSLAQFFPFPQEQPRYDPRFDPRYDPRLDQRYDPRFDQRYDPRFDRRNDPRFQRPRRVVFGDVCVTSRGACDAPRALPVNTSCRCFIRGFGPKRGAISADPNF